jgi:hypothetical protein
MVLDVAMAGMWGSNQGKAGRRRFMPKKTGREARHRSDHEMVGKSFVFRGMKI